ncbi:ThyA Thymidylate synthase [uncultured Caudovirales phage]|uniref:thymidylate synthase n=1 Tax=uncultured Caudovirales phage TaxID=2100421 RepID=A0A6J5PRP3_9CAUD|nr:ThyA Thymidylate synthase [uncultured Caudovirales phage]
MNTLDKKYQDLLQDILDNGVTKQDRTCTGTLSKFGYQIRHKMKEGFPLLTTKKMYWKGIVTELLWFLRGDTNIKYLVDNGCNIWTGDAYKKYHATWEMDTYGVLDALSQEEFINRIKTNPEFAKQWADLGPVYGKQWRSWYGGIGLDDDEYNIDQIQNLINDLKTNPDSRRLMVNAWNVGELDQMTLPPCHYGFQVYTRELSLEERNDVYKKQWEPGVSELSHDRFDSLNVPTRAISLMWNQRSVDTFLGLPFNIASYGLLLEIIAKEVNMVPDELIGNLGDTHLYLNHIEQAKEQIGRELSSDERKKLYENEFTPGMEVKNDEWLESKLTTREIPKRTREPYPLPKLDIHPGMLDYELDKLEIDMFKILDYQSHPHIKAPLSN